MNTLPTMAPFEIDSNYNNISHRWNKWLDKFENLLIALNINTTEAIQDSIRKRAILKHCAGDEINEILASNSTENTYEEALTTLNAFFGLQQNPESEIFEYRQIKQNDQETLDQFITRLKKKASMCEFTELERELRSQIILGCKSNKLRRHALRTRNITLIELRDLGRANESADRHAANIEKITEHINALELNPIKYNEHSASKAQGNQSEQPQSKYKYHKETNKPTYNQHEYQKPEPNRLARSRGCQYCGGQWHDQGLHACPAQGKTCHKCGKSNHLARVCKSSTMNARSGINKRYSGTPRRQTNLINDEEDTSSDHILANFTQSKQKNNIYETTCLTINDTRVRFIIDTGATVNIINIQDYKSITPQIALEPARTNIYAYASNRAMNIMGSINTNVKHWNQEHKIIFHVCEEEAPSLIGKQTAQQLGVIQFIHQLQYSHNNKEIQQIIEKHSKLFEGMGKHKRTTIELHIDKSIKPIAQKHRRIPYHIRNQVEEEIQELLLHDIIEPIPNTEPTTWISPIVVKPKKDNPKKIRICVDMKAANTAIQRERHITPTIEDIVYDLNKAQFFSKLDLNRGYHQFELGINSRHITTFSTHMGIYRYKRLSFGINSAAEIFQHQITMTLQGIKGAMNVSDDILIYGTTLTEHNKALELTLQRLQDVGLTLNLQKCSFAKRELTFLGYIFSNKGIHPDPNKIKSIQNMMPPTNQTETRSFLGMINFCCKFVPNLSDLSQPLRKLIKKNAKWKWEQEEIEAFSKIKIAIAKTTNIAYFDKHKHTELWVDASPIGLGAMLTQRNTDGKSNIIAFASHSLTDTEARYSHIEKEALAITWAINHFKLYLFGHPFTTYTDHKPLVTMFNKANQILSSRVERWKFKLQAYNFEVIYHPGKYNPSDYLSRHPSQGRTNQSENEILAENYINFIITNTIPKTMTIGNFKEEVAKDKTLQKIIKHIKNDTWHIREGKEDQEELKAYRKIRPELSIDRDANFLLRGTKLVVPKTIQKTVIQIAHSAHLGISKTKSLIREKLWFPAMDKMTDQVIRNCKECSAAEDNHIYPPLNPSDIPSGPWKVLNIDHKGPLPSGDYLLVIMDQYSKFPIVEIVPSTATNQNINKLSNIFAIFGYPDTIHTDNGAPFNSHDFKKFINDHDIKHKKITPRWPRANGTVERFNKTLGKILKITQTFKKDYKREIHHLLADYRNTPHPTTKISPAELMFNFRPKIKLPDALHIQTSQDQEEISTRIKQYQLKMTNNYNNRHNITYKLPIKGDWVMKKRETRSKANTNYDPEIYEVIETKGSMITARQGNKTTTRNMSQFKTINRGQEQPIIFGGREEDEPEQSDWEQPNTQSTTEIEMGRDNESIPGAKEQQSEEQITSENQRYNLRSTITQPKRLIEQC